MRQRVRGPAERGYSMMEMLAVLAIVASIILVSVPNIRAAYETNKLQTNARGVAGLLKIARMRAVSNNVDFVVALDPVMAALCPGRTPTSPNQAMVAYRLDETVPSECFSIENKLRVELVAPTTPNDKVTFRASGMARERAPNYYLVKSRNDRECQLVCVNAAGIVRVNKSGPRADGYCTAPYKTTTATPCRRDPAW